MHKDTVKHYDEKAETYAATYESADLGPFHELIRRWLPANGRVLEIGCGFGRDAEYMASVLGLEVVAADAGQKIIELATSLKSESSAGKIDFRNEAFPLPAGHELLEEQFEAVVAVAVLMHIPEHELLELACQIRKMLKPGGLFICSIPSAVNPSDEDPRLFIHREPDEVKTFFEPMGFRLMAMNKNDDGLGRPMTWSTLVFERQD